MLSKAYSSILNKISDGFKEPKTVKVTDQISFVSSIPFRITYTPYKERYYWIDEYRNGKIRVVVHLYKPKTNSYYIIPRYSDKKALKDIHQLFQELYKMYN